ncbi:MAG: hypothetical protein NTW19_01480 [Planctomycetota bacterium]|nr:hypothetical protein [Planctomycetota bacterium]
MPTLKQSHVGTRPNLVRNGAWWGENISKVARHGSNTFTYAFVADGAGPAVYLYARRDGGDWAAGEHFRASRPPNILVDTTGHVHLIGFEPFDAGANEYDGRLFHVRFDKADTVTGTYHKEFISEDWRPTAAAATYATIFAGAAIGADDTLLVAYNNSAQFDVPGQHSIGARIQDPATKTWKYEPVALNMKSRHAYPFAFVTATHFHVLTIEDDHDAGLVALGGRYADYPYRYGEVKHFQRHRSGGAWTESTLLSLNDRPGITKSDIWNARLRIVDFHVDSSGTAHALVACTGRFTGTAFVANGQRRCLHFSKPQGAIAWSNELVCDEELNAARLWENKEGKLFFIGAAYCRQLWAMPVGGSQRRRISDLSWWETHDPTPFLAGPRGGAEPSDHLHMTIFSGVHALPGVSIDVSLSGL